MKVYIGIIGALDEEVAGLISRLDGCESERVGGIEFHTGELFGKRIAVAKCGVGKVFAAACAEAMIVKYSPSLIVNTGVGGALDATLVPGNIVIADRLCQHDMDTTALGDAPGLISGINQVYFEADARAVKILLSSAKKLSLTAYPGTVASGDRFVANSSDKSRIKDAFAAVACEMEGAAIAQTAFINSTPFAVVRAISDSADGVATMDYTEFLPLAAKASSLLTEELIKNY